jgi:stage V sporulation protein K
MSIAGTWRDPNGISTVHISGAAPSFAFREHNVAGALVCEGFIQPQADGTFQLSGNGWNGPVRLRMWLSSPDVLQAQGQLHLDGGGPLDQLVGSFLPSFAALMPAQPVMTFVRTEPATLPASRPPERPPSTRPDNATQAQTERKAPPKQKQAPAASASPMAELAKLIGMQSVKAQLEQLEAWAWRQQELKSHDLATEPPSLHMLFAGGPGTGKTTIARIIGGLLTMYELLEHGRVHEVSRADLVGEFVGQTAPKTEAAIDAAIGGVLFVDEAYALSEPGAGGGRDYGAEAITALIAGMENHRHELCVIVAGYPDEMRRFIDTNPGLSSRISRHIEFPDYSDGELQQVLEAMASARKLSLDPRVLAQFQPYIRRYRSTVDPRQWGNARVVRNILERGIEAQSVRLRKAGGRPSKEQLLRLEPADFAFFAGRD